MAVERELKFRLSASAARRVWSLLPGSPPVRRRSVDSVYFDTPDQQLRKARSALRLRRDGRRRLMTFKSDSAPGTGFSQRGEWEVAVAGRGLDVDALPLAEIREVARIDLRRLERDLSPLFATRMTRRSADVALADGTTVEVSLDKGHIAAGRRRTPILELELELDEGNLAAMLEFADRLIDPLRLQLEPLSKAARGYRLAVGGRAAPVTASWPSLEKCPSAEAAMQSVLQACLAQVEGNVHGVTLATDAEYLHQLRVGMRRLRSALRTFEQLGNRKCFRAAAARAKELMPILGTARDWDVFCARLAALAQAEGKRSPGLAQLTRRARERRAAARDVARALAGSGRMQHFLLGMARWVHEAPWRGEAGAAPPLRKYAARSLARAERKLLRAVDDIDWANASQRHRVRIRVKRLRYACEPLATLYSHAKTRRYVDRLEALQDVLGELNDIAVGKRLLKELGASRDDAGAEFTRGWFAARETQQVSRLPGTWKSWKKAGRPW